MSSQPITGQRILVTGGAGTIGSALVDLLVDADAEVLVLDNFVRGLRANLSGAADRAGGRLTVARATGSSSSRAISTTGTWSAS